MSTDDEDLKKISRLLEVGATMLADHCTECGAPLFRYHGEVLCPLCSNQTNSTPPATKQTQPDKQLNDKTESHAQVEPVSVHVKHSPQPISTPTQNEQTALDDIIQTKISEIATNMSQESDLGRVKDQLECIEQAVKVLKLLK
ncbi:MAG: hypothetical protein KAH86_06330 [Methanosarcinales archaeon]|nr:hypothetical protein [Methanosarcinales archaeon]